MPLNLPIDNIIKTIKKGHLYVVATPIGNLGDITLRALAVLSEVDLIAAEDTRTTRHLLSFYEIETRLLSYHKFNENQRTAELITRLKQEQSIALVSDAGTPTISDPGYHLIKTATTENIPIVPIPGACAAIAALSASGLSTEGYTFAGFPPKKTGKQMKYLQSLSKEPRTLIFYESPKRLPSLLDTLMSIMGDRTAVLTRELTKMHEEFIRGKLSEIKHIITERKTIKGECTLLVDGDKKTHKPSWEQITSDIQQALLLKSVSLSELSKNISQKYGLPKQKIYEAALRLKDQNEPGDNIK